jgi:hypothetical protein
MTTAISPNIKQIFMIKIKECFYLISFELHYKSTLMILIKC